MTMKDAYQGYLDKRDTLKTSPMVRVWINQESRYVEPFRMYGNLYYVGDSWVCAHIVDTGNGLILFDAGNCGGGATAMLIYAIWKLGFDPADVKWLIVSHGHVDHIGAVNFFKRMFGTKIYMGAPDAENYRIRPELALIHESTDYMDELVDPDVEIHDGDVIDFGGTKILFHLAPGHTDGVIACYFDVTDGNETKRAGYFGGFGFNTLQKNYLQEIGDFEYEMRAKMMASFERARNQKVDLFMPNHCVNVDLLKKRQYQLEHPNDPNPFVDAEQWGNYFDGKIAELKAFMEDPKQN